MKHDESKQPVWVQDLLNDLRGRIEYLESVLKESGVERYSYRDLSPETLEVTDYTTARRFPSRYLVRFQLEEGRDQYVDCRITKDGLQVRGGSGIRIDPASGNLVYVKVERGLL